ncbi:MAG: CPBP family intramembrane metalloprotease [Clostridiales bacterium]|nr:CPBP family intramembrane metalloprotease [Clostridiales bacterium]
MTHGFSQRIRPYLPIPEKPTVGFVFGTCALAEVVLILLWQFIPQSVLVWSKTSLIGFSIITVCRLMVSLLLPLVFFISRYSMEDRRVYGINPGFGAIIHSILAGFPAMLLFVAIHNLSARFIILRGIPVPRPAIYCTLLDGSKEATALFFIIGAVLPILLEELFFRGLLNAVLPVSLHNARGYIWIAFLFAVYMLNPVDFIAFFLLGILLGFIRHNLDNVFCCILTRLSIVGSYLLFRSLMPYLDTSVIRTEADIDPTVLYIALTALIMGTLILIPILSQIRLIAGYLRMERMDETPGEDVPIRSHIGWSYWLGLLFFAGLWVLILEI